METTKRPFEIRRPPELMAQSNLSAFLRKTGETNIETLAARAELVIDGGYTAR